MKTDWQNYWAKQGSVKTIPALYAAIINRKPGYEKCTRYEWWPYMLERMELEPAIKEEAIRLAALVALGLGNA